MLTVPTHEVGYHFSDGNPVNTMSHETRLKFRTHSWVECVDDEYPLEIASAKQGRGALEMLLPEHRELHGCRPQWDRPTARHQIDIRTQASGELSSGGIPIMRILRLDDDSGANGDTRWKIERRQGGAHCDDINI